MSTPTLQEQFGQIDIYLFDQLLKGRITPGMTILDAGCGGGRNIIYFLREGYEVFGADADARTVEGIRALARQLAPGRPAEEQSAAGTKDGAEHITADVAAERFRVEPVERMSFDAACADVVICNTVLHFARDDAHFEAMLMGCWRVLKPGGLFFCRLGSTIGMESRVERINKSDEMSDEKSRRYKSPDGAERYLVDEALLVAHTARLGGELADPLKTTVVQDLRAMTTWVLWKKLP